MGQSLSSGDLSSVLRFVETMSASGEPDFVRVVLGGVSSLVRCDSAGYNEVDLRTRTVTAVVEPVEAARDTSPAEMEPYLHEHPVLREHARTGIGRSLKISDFLSEEELHRLDLYRAVYAPLGIEDQMSLSVTDPGALTVAVALNRDRRDFTERDRAVLDLVRPHLATAFRHLDMRERAQALLRAFDEGLDQTGRGLVVLDSQGGIDAATDRAHELMRTYLAPAPSPAALPAELSEWLGARARTSGLDTLEAPISPIFVVERDGVQLFVRHLARVEPGDAELLLLGEDRVDLRPAIAELGILAREAEVLEQVALGLSNPEIADRLGMSPRTVSKHLERIYPKLGVSGRSAATAAVHRAARAS